jgi:hypothetical protein
MLMIVLDGLLQQGPRSCFVARFVGGDALFDEVIGLLVIVHGDLLRNYLII